MPIISISFAESALRDLEVVRVWYAEQGVPDVGARLVAEVFQRIQALVGHPDMGRVVPEFDQPFLREFIHPPFRIVYRRDPNGEGLSASGAVSICCVVPRLTSKRTARP